ncbi:MAG: sigma-54-dependent Fis family transcriptional regulator [Deltaproteobacteria bacterium]|nr:sigma-54-dependent Fis family transcriptional regulator [Deltaproteobacteria bacterium]
MKNKLLVLDDDVDFVAVLTAHLEARGYSCLKAFSIAEAYKIIVAAPLGIELILCDVNLPDGTGIDFITRIKAINSNLPIIMVSAQSDTQMIVDAISRGASDYVSKPFDHDLLISKISNLIEINQKREARHLLSSTLGTKGIIGNSPAIKNLIREITKVSVLDSPVILYGESGTGKTLFAEILHENSPRKARPLVTVNCAAIPSELLESEFFGHVKGAFTGAVVDKMGKFEHADGSTIFLDEIGDMAIGLQAKLLRVLQGKEFEKVGGLKTIRVDVRVIAATNRDLETLVSERRFREDLYYRLNVLPLYIPPLRHRKSDIPMFVEHYLRYNMRKTGKTIEPLSVSVLDMLVDYYWPGNIRELQNVIERAVVLANSPRLEEGDFLIRGPLVKKKKAAQDDTHAAPVDLREIEKRALISTLEKTGGNIARAAAILKISRDTIYRRLKKYGVKLKKG